MDKAPLEQVQQLATSYFVSRALHSIVELGVADALDDRATPVDVLAAATGANEDALFRVLRLLSSYGVFELNGTSVSHTPASELLRSDHPTSMQDFVRMTGSSLLWRSAEAFFHSVRTGEAATPQMFPDGGFWGHLAQHPDEARLFDAAMTARASGQIGAIVCSYDFSQFRSLADIGGGRGHLLRAVLEAHPGSTGVLFDLPHVVEAARSAGDMQGRLTFHAGDFFKGALPSCDGYILMEILHDWAEPAAQEIVSAVRRAVPPHAKLLVIETVVPEGAAPDWSKTLDIVMLALFAGRQRTAEQYRDLLRRGGFDMKREIDTGAGVSIFEAEPI